MQRTPRQSRFDVADEGGQSHLDLLDDGVLLSLVCLMVEALDGGEGFADFALGHEVVPKFVDAKVVAAGGQRNRNTTRTPTTTLPPRMF